MSGSDEERDKGRRGSGSGRDSSRYRGHQGGRPGSGSQRGRDQGGQRSAGNRDDRNRTERSGGREGGKPQRPQNREGSARRDDRRGYDKNDRGGRSAAQSPRGGSRDGRDGRRFDRREDGPSDRRNKPNSRESASRDDRPRGAGSNRGDKSGSQRRPDGGFRNDSRGADAKRDKPRGSGPNRHEDRSRRDDRPRRDDRDRGDRRDGRPRRDDRPPRDDRNRGDRRDDRPRRDDRNRDDRRGRPAGKFDDKRGHQGAPHGEKKPRSSGSKHDGDAAKKQQAPELPDDIEMSELDGEVQRELRTLPKALAEMVASHLIAAGRFIEEEPDKALEHARYARAKASRVASVREANGIAAYQAGEWGEALSELRAFRRMAGGPGYMAIVADAERALGRPERAIEMSRSEEATRLEAGERIELRIVAAGARRDMGEVEASVVGLQIPELDPERQEPWSARLFYAYADNLLAAGRVQESFTWFVHAANADDDGETDAPERLDELVDVLGGVEAAEELVPETGAGAGTDAESEHGTETSERDDAGADPEGGAQSQ